MELILSGGAAIAVTDLADELRTAATALPFPTMTVSKLPFHERLCFGTVCRQSINGMTQSTIDLVVIVSQVESAISCNLAQLS